MLFLCLNVRRCQPCVHSKNSKQGTELNLENELEAIDSLLEAPGGHVKARLRRVSVCNARPVPTVPARSSVIVRVCTAP